MLSFLSTENAISKGNQWESMPNPKIFACGQGRMWPGHFGIFECGRVNLGSVQSLRPGQILEGILCGRLTLGEISCGRVSKKCGSVKFSHFE